MVRVCFVCLGNICRSPTAHGVMLRLVEQQELQHIITVESAGTADYHVGESPDPRTLQAARRHGVELRSRGQHFRAPDFARFDHVLAMDRANHRDLVRLAPDAQAKARVRLFREFDRHAHGDLDVPDPYYGDAAGFERVFRICEAGCQGLLEFLVRTHDLRVPRA